MSSHAPITGDVLHRALTDLGVDIRTLPGKPPVAVIDNAEVRIPFPTRRQLADDRTLRRLAAALDITRRELVEVFLDGTVVKRGRNAGALAAPEPTGPTKADVLAQVAALRQKASEIEAWARCGTRSPATFQRLADDLYAASRPLNGWPPPANTTIEAPDDSGYRPPSGRSPPPVPWRSPAGCTRWPPAAVAAPRRTLPGRPRTVNLAPSASVGQRTTASHPVSRRRRVPLGEMAERGRMAPLAPSPPSVGARNHVHSAPSRPSVSGCDCAPLMRTHNRPTICAPRPLLNSDEALPLSALPQVRRLSYLDCFRPQEGGAV